MTRRLNASEAQAQAVARALAAEARKQVAEKALDISDNEWTLLVDPETDLDTLSAFVAFTAAVRSLRALASPATATAHEGQP